MPASVPAPAPEDAAAAIAEAARPAVALLIDHESLRRCAERDTPGQGPDWGALLRYAQARGLVEPARAYGEWSADSDRGVVYAAGVEPVFSPVLRTESDRGGKSLADPLLVVQGMDLLWTAAPEVLVLCSVFKDPVPLVRAAKQRGIHIVVVGTDQTDPFLRDMADEHVRYASVLGVEPPVYRRTVATADGAVAVPAEGSPSARTRRRRAERRASAGAGAGAGVSATGSTTPAVPAAAPGGTATERVRRRRMRATAPTEGSTETATNVKTVSSTPVAAQGGGRVGLRSRRRSRPSGGSEVDALAAVITPAPSPPPIAPGEASSATAATTRRRRRRAPATAAEGVEVMPALASSAPGDEAAGAHLASATPTPLLATDAAPPRPRRRPSLLNRLAKVLLGEEPSAD